MGFSQDRLLDVLSGKVPVRIPFIDRMDFWHRGLSFQHKLPEAYLGQSLEGIHQLVGVGMEDWRYPYIYRHRRMELTIRRDGETIFQAYEPEIFDFPSLWDNLPIDTPGEYTSEALTPDGRLNFSHRVSHEGLEAGSSRAIMVERPVKNAEDALVFQKIIEQAELVPRFVDFHEAASRYMNFGFLVPKLGRMPFQALLLDIYGEIELFYALHDDRVTVQRLMKALDIRMRELLELSNGLKIPYVELIDNLDGMMTNPRLFREHLIENYQSYAEILHAQGKLLGSHTDGNLRGLTSLLADSGLDVCEFFTPTAGCPFESAWNAWEKKPLIWEGIPSTLLENRVSEQEFREEISRILAFASRKPIILGIGDAVMTDNLLERVKWIADRVEEIEVCWEA